MADTRAAQVTFSIPELLRKFHDAPGKFLREFGMTGVHGIIAWLLIAPILSALIYFRVAAAAEKTVATQKMKC
jgi:hypothetical protein